MHKVCDHPVTRKMLEHRLRTSGFNASLELFSIMYHVPDLNNIRESDKIDPHAKGSLFVDLFNPLPVNGCIRGVCQRLPEPADVAAELPDVVGADLI